ncbi:MAG: TetR/AcrR family transcriptional regulator [Dehalococcoidia bacterium]
MGRTSDAREKLIESTVELIHSRSYSQVGVNELCRHAGVKKGSFYHFFPSKQDLTLAALERFMEIFRSEFNGSAYAGPMPASDRIQQVFELMYQHQRDTLDATGHVWGCPAGNLAVELSTQDEPIRQKVQQIFQLMQEMVEQVLQESVSNGDLPELDTATTAQALVAYMEGVLLISKTWNDPEIIRQLASKVPQLLIPTQA